VLGGPSLYTLSLTETADVAKENWQRLYFMYSNQRVYNITYKCIIIVYISKNACDRVIFQRLYNVFG